MITDRLKEVCQFLTSMDLRVISVIDMNPKWYSDNTNMASVTDDYDIIGVFSDISAVCGDHHVDVIAKILWENLLIILITRKSMVL